MPTYNGTHGNDVLIGNFDDDIFYGHGGNDRFEGGNGNDIYYVDDNNDVVVESQQHGYDTIYTAGSYTLAAGVNVEVLSTDRHSGTAAINLTGNSLDNLLIGNGGANILDGGGGAGDRLAGLGGNDTYYINNPAVQIIEEEPDGTYARGGSDTLYVGFSYVLGANLSVEILSTNSHAGTAAINLTGNGFDNEILGNAGANILNGGGGAGDRLLGLGGDDTYYVDVATTRVFEAAGGGSDTVYTSVDYTLGGSQEIERLATSNDVDTTALSLTGNDLDNQVTGNAGANILRGGGGEDVLVGLGGNDIYYVNSAGDQVVEAAAGGNRDFVYASVSYALADGVYAEVLSTVSNAATTAIDLTGNSNPNEIVGNEGANVLAGLGGDDTLFGLGGDDRLFGGGANDYLYGGAGNDILDGGDGGDRMSGGAGDDTYYVDSFNVHGDPLDAIGEAVGGGSDILYSNAAVYNLNGAAEVEILALTGPFPLGNRGLGGNEFAQEIRGDEGGNTLSGGGGNDVLFGYGGDDGLSGDTGMDVMTGGAGADGFAFIYPLGPNNVDTITDFLPGTDMIQLNSGVFHVSMQQLQSGAFHTGAAAADANDRIIYDPATGALYFDPDGIGGAAQILFANLSAGLNVTATDFIVP